MNIPSYFLAEAIVQLGAVNLSEVNLGSSTSMNQVSTKLQKAQNIFKEMLANRENFPDLTSLQENQKDLKALKGKMEQLGESLEVYNAAWHKTAINAKYVVKSWLTWQDGAKIAKLESQRTTLREVVSDIEKNLQKMLSQIDIKKEEIRFTDHFKDLKAATDLLNKNMIALAYSDDNLKNQKEFFVQATNFLKNKELEQALDDWNTLLQALNEWSPNLQQIFTAPEKKIDPALQSFKEKLEEASQFILTYSRHLNTQLDQINKDFNYYFLLPEHSEAPEKDEGGASTTKQTVEAELKKIDVFMKYLERFKGKNNYTYTLLYAYVDSKKLIEKCESIIAKNETADGGFAEKIKACQDDIAVYEEKIRSNPQDKRAQELLGKRQNLLISLQQNQASFPEAKQLLEAYRGKFTALENQLKEKDLIDANGQLKGDVLFEFVCLPFENKYKIPLKDLEEIRQTFSDYENAVIKLQKSWTSSLPILNGSKV